MEDRIQVILNAQGKALESRNAKVKKVRQQLLFALEDIAYKRKNDLGVIAAELQEDNKILKKEQLRLEKRMSLENSLKLEQNSDLSIQTVALDSELDELNKAIAELHAKKSAVKKRRDELDSIIASRTAKYMNAIADLDRSQSVDLATFNFSQERILSNRQKQQQFDAEYKAATNGKELWQKVCNELDSLDEALKKLKRDQLPQISFLLSSVIRVIEEYHSMASQSGWSVLVVAISHELKILKETLTAVKDACSN